MRETPTFAPVRRAHRGLLSACCLLFLSLRGQVAVPAPAAPATIDKVENAGLLFTDNHAGVTGTDAGYSIDLGNKSLWLFGDVFLADPVSPDRKYVGSLSNCALLVPAGRGPKQLSRYRFLTDPRRGIARQVLPNAPDEPGSIRLWPFGGWFDSAAKRVYLFYGKIQVTGNGPLDFRSLGTGLAVSNASAPESIEFARVARSSEHQLWWQEEKRDSTFGNAVIDSAPGEYLYVVGVQTRAGRKYGKIARVLKSRIAQFAGYEYYAGGDTAPRWTGNAIDAADVEGLVDFPTELSIAFNRYLGGYVAVHSVGLSERGRLSLAPNPWGPYKPIGEIGTPHRAFGRGFCYAGKEHPELSEEDGRVIYITYVDSERYWLQLLRVTFKR